MPSYNTIIFAFIVLFAFNTYSQESTNDKASIASVIQSAYIDGLQNEGDSVKIDEGFHPDFRLLGKGDLTALRKYDIAHWRRRQIDNNAAGKLPRAADKKIGMEVVFIDVTGDVAVAKINYFEGETRTYVDYISLYRYGSAWKIVSKIYQGMLPAAH